MIKSITSTFSIRTDYVIFPIDSKELLNALNSRGYQVLRPNFSQAPPGSRIEVVGQIATKGQAQVEIDGGSQILTIRSKYPEDSIATFTDVYNVIKGELRIELDSHAKFYECTSTIEVHGKLNPLAVLRYQKNSTVDKLKDILNIDISVFSLHICSPSDTINQEDWYDINIRPSSLESDRVYDVTTTFRNKDKPKVIGFLIELENKVGKIIEVLEENYRNESKSK